MFSNFFQKKSFGDYFLNNLVTFASLAGFVLTIVMAYRRFKNSTRPTIEYRRIEKLLDGIQKRQNRKVKIKLSEWEKFVANDIIEPDEIPVNFDDIGGLDEVKSKLHDIVIAPMKFPKLFTRGKLSKAPKGILFYGPPGTGKTMLAKAISRQSECVFINLQFSSIFQKWLGDSEKVIEAAFSLAKKIEPCIIFIDEIDCLFGERSQRDHEVTKRVKALFMSYWDGLTTNDSAITIIGATNRPGTIDEAILRRMPYTFLVDMPDKTQREAILKVVLRDEPIEKDFDFEGLAEQLENYSGSDIYALCQTAARIPVSEYLEQQRKSSGSLSPDHLRYITFEDFLQATKVVKPSGQNARQYEQKKYSSQPENPFPQNVNLNFFVSNNE